VDITSSLRFTKHETISQHTKPKPQIAEEQTEMKKKRKMVKKLDQAYQLTNKKTQP